MAVELIGNLLAAIDVPLTAPSTLPTNAIDVPTSSFANVLNQIQAQTKSNSSGTLNPTVAQAVQQSPQQASELESDGGLPDRIVTTVSTEPQRPDRSVGDIQGLISDQNTTIIARAIGNLPPIATSTLGESFDRQATPVTATPVTATPSKTLSRSEAQRFTRSGAVRGVAGQPPLLQASIPAERAERRATEDLRTSDRETPRTVVVQLPSAIVLPQVTTAATLAETPRAATRIPSVLPQAIVPMTATEALPQTSPNLGSRDVRPPVAAPTTIQGINAYSGGTSRRLDEGIEDKPTLATSRTPIPQQRFRVTEELIDAQPTIDVPSIEGTSIQATPIQAPVAVTQETQATRADESTGRSMRIPIVADAATATGEALNAVPTTERDNTSRPFADPSREFPALGEPQPLPKTLLNEWKLERQVMPEVGATQEGGATRQPAIEFQGKQSQIRFAVESSSHLKETLTPDESFEPTLEVNDTGVGTNRIIGLSYDNRLSLAQQKLVRPPQLGYQTSEATVPDTISSQPAVTQQDGRLAPIQSVTVADLTGTIDRAQPMVEQAIISYANDPRVTADTKNSQATSIATLQNGSSRLITASIQNTGNASQPPTSPAEPRMMQAIAPTQIMPLSFAETQSVQASEVLPALPAKSAPDPNSTIQRTSFTQAIPQALVVGASVNDPGIGPVLSETERTNQVPIMAAIDASQESVSFDREGIEVRQPLAQFREPQDAIRNVSSHPQIAQQISVPVASHFSLGQARLGSQELRMQLNPEELGSVRVRLISDEQTLRAEIVVRDAGTRQLVEQQIPELRARLEANGITLTRCDVQTEQATTNMGSSDHHSTGQRFESSRQGNHEQSRGREQPTAQNQEPNQEPNQGIATRFVRRTAARPSAIDVTA
jgi:flagellar hook-length control protein FliK